MVKVSDIAYIRLRSPDLDLQERFLLDFGMQRSARTATALYMRGTDPAHHIHITELGEPGLIGMGFYVQSEAELHEAATIEGASPVENIDEPGGGKRVRLREPNGYLIEIVHGIAQLAPIPVERNTMNWGEDRGIRAGDEKRLKPGPSRVKRIGHCVFAAPDQKTTLAWFNRNLGLVNSDVYYAGSEDNVVATFARVDRGEDYVDHHALFCTGGAHAGLNHIGFEVQDIDDVAVGHDYLKAKGYEHAWGIGRHLSGSQVFDYWFDPWKRLHEHWTDTDLLNNKNPTHVMPISQLRSQWGEPAPAWFGKHITP